MADQGRSLLKQNTIHVIFRKIEESYHINADISVHYSISGALEVTNKDWIGLYKVGWRSHSDYVYYEWSPYPNEYVKGSEIENIVVFPASRLPNEDGEFYQFCYITSSGQVRGASTPFQFKSVIIEDLIEVEDETEGLLVVKTKTSYLEECLEKSNDANTLLKQKVEVVEIQLGVLHLSQQELGRKLEQSKEKEECLKLSLEETNDYLADQRQVNAHLQDCINSLQDKIDVLEQEKHSVEKRLDDNESYISSLQDMNKNLGIEKDSLNVTVRVMEDEMKTFKKTIFHDHEVMRSKLAAEEMNNGKLRKEIDHGEKELIKMKLVYEQLAQINTDDRCMIENLSERSQNAEDKLSTAEHCKKMLNDEVLSLKQAHEQAILQYETSKNQVEGLRKSLKLLENQHLSDKEQFEKENSDLKLELESKNDIVRTLEVTVEVVENKLDVEQRKQDEDDGSLFALQVAHKTLAERYANLSKKFEAFQKSNEIIKFEKQDLEAENIDLKKDGNDLRDRLIMCQQSYKNKYAECEKVKSELNNVAHSASCNGNNGDLSSGSSMDTSEEAMQNKLKKYKKLLWKEVEKNDELRKILEEKNKEIEQLRKFFDIKDTQSKDSMIGEGFPVENEAIEEKQEDSESQEGNEQQLFVDANESLRTCPYCRISFDTECEDVVVMDHIERHMTGFVCPMCNEQFDERVSEETFSNHVQNHF